MTNFYYKIPTGYVWDGEPRMCMVDGGVDWEVRGGQPVMDAGIENWALISLFTESDPYWWGNYVLDGEYRLGDSNFVAILKDSITRTGLIDADKEVRRALELMKEKRIASEIKAELAINEQGGLDLVVQVYGPVSTLLNLLIQKHGLNWVMQATDPANERLTDEYRGNIS